MYNMGTKLYLLPVAGLAIMNVFVFGVQAQEITNVTTGNSSIYKYSCDWKQNQLCIPTCCGPNEILKRSKEHGYKCERAPKINNIYQYLVFDSNETHINTTSDTQTLPVFQRNLTCTESRVLKETSNEFGLGFIFNSSVILVDLSKREISLIPPTNYCIDYRDNNYTWFQVCGARPEPVPSLEYYFYFAFLIASTICYFISAFFYICVLKVDDIHKMCFVGYTVSMGFAFLFLIFLQSYDTKCDTLGFFFFTFMVCGFLWLMFLCLDLAVEVKCCMEAQASVRWLWYLIVSIAFPIMMASISFIPDGQVNVPKAFTKEFYYGHVYCRFNKSRLEFFFIPVGFLMLASLICLCATIYYLRVNNRDYRNNFNWLDKRSSYKYMWSRVLKCVVIFVLIFLLLTLELILNLVPLEGTFISALQMYEALLGGLTLTLVGSTYYHQKTIEKESGKNEVEMQRL